MASLDFEFWKRLVRLPESTGRTAGRTNTSAANTEARGVAPLQELSQISGLERLGRRRGVVLVAGAANCIAGTGRRRSLRGPPEVVRRLQSNRRARYSLNWPNERTDIQHSAMRTRSRVVDRIGAVCRKYAQLQQRTIAIIGEETIGAEAAEMGNGTPVGYVG